MTITDLHKLGLWTMPCQWVTIGENTKNSPTASQTEQNRNIPVESPK